MFTPRHLLVAFTAAFCLAIPLAAQDNPTSLVYPADTITVTGTGQASAAPDTATIFLGVEINDSDLATAFQQSNSTIDAVIESLMTIGIERRDLRTADLNVYINNYGPQPSLDVESDQPQFSYGVRNQVRVFVRDVTQIEAIINAGVDAGVNNIYGLDFRIQDTKSLEADARRAAVEDARERAADLAQLAGVELGDVIFIQEGQSAGFQPFNQDFERADSDTSGGSAAIEPGEISVSSSITISYRIVRSASSN